MLPPASSSFSCCGQDVPVYTHRGRFCQAFTISKCINGVPESEAYVCSERSRRLPSGAFNWIKPFWQIPDTFVLDHSSLDAFLFLRFLKILIVIFFVGCCLTWPILIPLHATGGRGNTELDRVTFGNIVSPRRYYAHAFLAWIYFGE